MKKRKNFSEFLKYGSIAAGLVVMLGVGMLFIDNRSQKSNTIVPESSNVVENNDNTSNEQTDLHDKPERYVKISILLPSS